MAYTVLTGYLVLTHLQGCVREEGCMLKGFTKQSVTNFRPQTLAKSGCSLFTVKQAKTPGSFHLSSCTRYLQIDDREVSTVDNPSTEVEFIHLTNPSQVTGPNRSMLTDLSQPFCIAEATSTTGKDCLAVSPDNAQLEYLTDTDCTGQLSRFAAWNFVTENKKASVCGDSCPVSVFSGFTVEVTEKSGLEAKNALLYAKPSYGVRLKAGSQVEVTGQLQRIGYLTINCAASISYLCFETRKVNVVTMLFHDNTGRVISRKVKPKYPPLFHKSCVKKLPNREVYRISFKFSLMPKTEVFFFRRLDMGGCHEIF